MSIFNINDFNTEQNFTLEELDSRFVNSEGDIIENLTVRNIQLYDSSNIIFGDSSVQNTAFSQEYKDSVQTQINQNQPIDILPLANIFTNQINTFKQINVDKLQLNGLPRHAFIDVTNKDLEFISANTNSKIKLIINKNNFGYSETEYTLSRDSLHCNNKDIAGVKQLIFNDGSVQNTAFTDTNKLQLETVAQQLTDITYEPLSDSTTINNNLNINGLYNNINGHLSLHNNDLYNVNWLQVNNIYSSSIIQLHNDIVIQNNKKIKLNGTSILEFADGSTMNTAPVSTDLSSLNSQIQTLNTKTTNLSFAGTTTTLGNNLNIIGNVTLNNNSINGTSTIRFSDGSTMNTAPVSTDLSSLNSQIQTLNTKTTNLSFSGTTTTLGNNLNMSDKNITSINSITGSSGNFTNLVGDGLNIPVEIQALKTKTVNMTSDGTTITLSNHLNMSGKNISNITNVASTNATFTNLTARNMNIPTEIQTLKDRLVNQSSFSRGLISLSYQNDTTTWRTASLTIQSPNSLVLGEPSGRIYTPIAGIYCFTFAWSNALLTYNGGYEDYCRFNITPDDPDLTITNMFNLQAGGGANYNNTWDNHNENPKIIYKNVPDINGNTPFYITMKHNDDGFSKRGNRFFITFTMYLNGYHGFYLQFKAGRNALSLTNGVWSCQYLGN